MLELNFSPFPYMETDRLILRSITIQDAPALFYLRNNEQVMQYIDRPRMSSVFEAEKFIQNILDMLEKNDAVFWVIALKDKPELMIGNVGFWRIEKENYRAEIGYLLHNDYWKKGIMKEACSKVISYGFKRTALHSIEANINPENTASQVLLESLGFTREGYFKENYYYDGRFTDSAIYSLLRK